MTMDTPWMSVAGACALVALLAGCAGVPAVESPPRPEAPQKPAVVAKTAAEHPPGWSDTQVVASVKYVRIQGTLPEAKGALAFLAGDAALRTGTVTMTREQAEAALAELARITGQKVESSPRVTVVSGGAARIGIGFTQQLQSEAANSVKIMVGGIEQEFRMRAVGAELAVIPRVLADGLIQLHTAMQVTTFDGFVVYPSKRVKTPPTGPDEPKVKEPDGFYQPIFSTIETAAEVRLAPGEVVVLKAEEEPKEIDVPDGAARVLKAEGGRHEKKTLLIFLTAQAVTTKA